MPFTYDDEIGLLVADVPWSFLHAALEATSGERFAVGAPVADAANWYQEFLAPRVSTLLVGEHRGRSYVTCGHSIAVPSNADQLAAVAAATGALVLGHVWFGTVASGDGIAVRGNQLLRYVVESQFDRYAEGNPLPGETDDATIATPEAFMAVLAALGFDLDGWFDRAPKFEVTWTSLDPDADPVAFARVYRGPIRMRSIWIDERAADLL
jgi:hypothetical protein